MLLAQAVDNSSWIEDVGVPLLAALIGALVGGAAAAFGSSVVVKRDLLERNRHALLMEDLPAFEAAMGVNGSLAFDAGGHADVNAAADELTVCVRQLKVRSSILGGEERRLGKLIDRSAGREALSAQVKALTDLSMKIIDGN